MLIGNGNLGFSLWRWRSGDTDTPDHSVGITPNGGSRVWFIYERVQTPMR